MLTVIKKIFLAFSKKERVLFLVALLTAAVSSVILSNIVLANISTTLPARGGNYTEGVVGQPRSFFPNELTAQHDKTISHMIYRGLFKYDIYGALVPDLAESWTVSNGGLVYTIKLKANQNL